MKNKQSQLRRYWMLYILLVISVGLLFINTILADAPPYTIDGDRVYIDDEFVALSAEPHTLHQSDWVYLNLTSKQFTGDIDLVLGFNTEASKPTTAELRYPKVVHWNTTHQATKSNVISIETTTALCDVGYEYNNIKRNVTNLLSDSYYGDNYEYSAVYCFDSYVNNSGVYTITWHQEHSENRDWLDVTSRFQTVNYEYGGMNKWYYVKNINVEAGKNYQLRVYVTVPISSMSSDGKYWVAIKRSSDTIQEAIASSRLYYLDPWWNTTWAYRTPISAQELISVTIPDQPVKMDISAVNCSNDDKSDARIVFNNSGTHVEIPSVVLDDNSTIVFTANVSADMDGNWGYLYCNNSAASTGVYPDGLTITSSAEYTITFNKLEAAMIIKEGGVDDIKIIGGMNVSNMAGYGVWRGGGSGPWGMGEFSTGTCELKFNSTTYIKLLCNATRGTPDNSLEMEFYRNNLMYKYTPLQSDIPYSIFNQHGGGVSIVPSGTIVLKQQNVLGIMVNITGASTQTMAEGLYAVSKSSGTTYGFGAIWNISYTGIEPIEPNANYSRIEMATDAGYFCFGANSNDCSTNIGYNISRFGAPEAYSWWGFMEWDDVKMKEMYDIKETPAIITLGAQETSGGAPPANEAPTIAGTAIAPDPAYTNTNLNCSATPTDAENTSLQVEFTWLNESVECSGCGYDVNVTATNNTQTFTTILVTETKEVGSNWTCRARAWDGDDWSGHVNDTLQISNTPPTTTGLAIAPDPAYTNSNLNCSATAHDIDSENVTMYWSWAKNGVVNDTLNYTKVDSEPGFLRWTSTLFIASKAVGDNITCSLLLSDGTDFSIRYNNTLQISNTLPSWDETPGDVTYAAVDNVIYDVNATDVDARIIGLDSSFYADSYGGDWAHSPEEVKILDNIAAWDETSNETELYTCNFSSLPADGIVDTLYLALRSNFSAFETGNDELTLKYSLDGGMKWFNLDGTNYTNTSVANQTLNLRNYYYLITSSISWSNLSNLCLGVEGMKVGAPDDEIVYIDGIWLKLMYQGPDTGQALQYFINDTMFDINNVTGIINRTTSTPDIGIYHLRVNVTDGLSWLNASFVLTISNTLPVTPANLTWLTRGGELNGTSLRYNEEITDVNVSTYDADGNLNVSAILFDPAGTLVTQTNLTNTTASRWNGTLNYVLNKAGNWNLTFSAYDGMTYSNNSVIIDVTITLVNTTGGWYGFTFERIPNSADFSNIIPYEYEIVEIEDDINNLDDNWTAILVAINDSYDGYIRSSLNLVLSFNYTNTTRLAELVSDISSNLGELKDDPYSITIEYITFEVEDVSLYNDGNLTNVLNSLAEEVIDVTDNNFPVYSKTYNSSNLDSSYILDTVFIYLDYDNETDLINAEASLLRNTTNLNRIYVNLSATLKSVAKTYQDTILTQIRGLPTGNNSLTDTRTAEINGILDDVVIFNNQSTEQVFTINISEFLACNNKDLWESTNNILIESDSDLNFSVNVSRYSAVLIFCEDLSHIQLTSSTGGTVYKINVGDISSFNYTNGTFTDAFAIMGADDAKIELNDPHFIRNKFITYYGWLNASYVTNWADYDIVIIADKNDAEIDSLPLNETDFYGYISVADYANVQEWTDNKTQEVDDWLALNESLHIFADGLDTGIGGTNFSTRMKELVDYVKIAKDRKVGLNTYTAYADFCTWSRPDGFCMKESCVNRWNGTDPADVLSYERENWELELNKSAWYTSHEVTIVCQIFSNRTTNPISIENYTEVQSTYFGAKVLGYDKVYISQPDFQYAFEEWFYDTGDMLASDYSTDDNETYYRRYSKGIVYYNSSTGQGWIDDGRIINNVEVCMKLQDSTDVGGSDDTGFSFGVASGPNSEQNDEYSWTASEITTVKAWYCKNLTSTDIFTNGRYFVNMRITDRAETPGNAIFLLNDVESEMGRHSWWDTTAGDPVWTIYDEDKNWMVSIKINETKKTSIDTTTKITQSEVSNSPYKNITLSSSYVFGLEIWSAVINYSFNYPLNVSYWNGSEFISMNLSESNDCDSDNPTFVTTTIAAETHKACYKNDGGVYSYRFAAPSLSSRLYRIGLDDSCGVPSVGTSWAIVDNCTLSNFIIDIVPGNLTLSTGHRLKLINTSLRIDGLRKSPPSLIIIDENSSFRIKVG